MVKPFISLLVLIGLLCACTPKGGDPSRMLQANKAPLSVTKRLPAFQYVNIEGRMNVRWVTTRGKPKLVLRADARDIPYIQSLVEHNRLKLVIGNGYPRFGPVQATLYTPPLKGFSYKGVGFIKARALSARAMALDITNDGKTSLAGSMGLTSLHLNGTGYTEISGVHATNIILDIKGAQRVKLAGVVSLSTLTLAGKSWLSLYWVKSRYLTVRACDEAFIQLAGVAQIMDLALKDKAHFNGRYLRVHRVYAKTYDHAIAEITALQRQHSLARDASDIYYYKIPTMKADFMANNGAVLDMRDWDPFKPGAYTTYNK